jgi:hypothetical protein
VPLRVTGPVGIALLIVCCVAAGAWIPAWAPPLLLALAGLTLVVLRFEAIGGIVVGTLLAALSASLGAGVVSTGWGGQLRSFDLRSEAIPDDVTGEVELTGHLRTDWMLDEYRVERGKRPDSARESSTVLAPLLGTTEDVVTHAGRVVVARLDRERANGAASDVVTLRGELQPLPDELLTTLFATHAKTDTKGDGSEPIRGVLLDSLAPPRQMRSIGSALTSALLGAIGLLILALVLGDGESTANGLAPEGGAQTPDGASRDRAGRGSNATRKRKKANAKTRKIS